MPFTSHRARASTVSATKSMRHPRGGVQVPVVRHGRRVSGPAIGRGTADDTRCTKRRPGFAAVTGGTRGGDLPSRSSTRDPGRRVGPCLGMIGGPAHGEVDRERWARPPGSRLRGCLRPARDDDRPPAQPLLRHMRGVAPAVGRPFSWGQLCGSLGGFGDHPAGRFRGWTRHLRVRPVLAWPPYVVVYRSPHPKGLGLALPRGDPQHRRRPRRRATPARPHPRITKARPTAGGAPLRRPARQGVPPSGGARAASLFRSSLTPS